MIRNRILSALEEALQTAALNLNGLAVDDPSVWEAVCTGLKLERPRNPEHGDFAVNVSFLARQTKMPPPKIAEALAATLNHPDFEVSIVGGYLNFKLSEALLRQALADIVHCAEPAATQERKTGQNNTFAGERILLEYVSANPTGPLHIGHGRWAALGDSIVRILRHCGATVTPEFYINDAGVQIRNLGHSLWFRLHHLEFPKPKEGEKSPFYPGDYVIDLAEKFKQTALPKLAPDIQDYLSDPTKDPFIEKGQDFQSMNEQCARSLCDFAKEEMLIIQKKLLDEMRVYFEGNFISEEVNIHDAGLIPETLETLSARGFTYEAEDALWFKSTEFGDEKDRVLRKSNGEYTYLTPDIAYHNEKFNRKIPVPPTSENPGGEMQPYTKIVNIWGADHHGYIARMRGAIQALGHDANKFEVLLGQLVNLIVDGERTRMGKRRKMLTLSDVVEEVGVDATRFWMVSKSADSSLDFDVDLAASASSENPVFYVQYAHARCASILRNATEPVLNTETGETGAPFVTAEALAQYEETLTPEALRLLFDSMPDERDRNVLKTLLLQLDDFGQTIQDAARLRSPHLLTQYMMALAAQFHSFYGVCRILTPEPELTKSRLMLILALRKTLAQALDLIGVSAPKTM